MLKNRAIKDFIAKLMPVLTADNQPKHIEIYLERELATFYLNAFCDGQENVLPKGVK